MLTDWLAGQSWGTSSRRGYRSALRSFYTWGAAEGYAQSDPTRALLPIAPPLPKPRPAPMVAVEVALEVEDWRVRIAVRLAVELGMRRGEVAACHSDDLERDLVGWSLHVHGKGNRDRRLPVPDDLASAIQRCGAGYLLPGRINGHLSPRWIGKLVAKALPGAWTMHTLRHRFATDVHTLTRDLAVTQDLLGHASPVTTRAYVQVPDERLRAAVNAVAVARAEAA